MLCKRTALLVVLLGVLLPCNPLRSQPVKEAPAEKSPAANSFLRLTREKGRTPTALSASIVRFVPQDCGKTGPTVDLIAAVHVADKAYYAELNRQFEKYDAVLYELVAPAGTRIPKGGGKPGAHPVSMIQKLMSDVLRLQFQLEGIDYTAQNLVHADMSPEQFAKSMEARGESVWSTMLRMMGYAMARQGGDSSGSSDAKLLMALFDKNQALALKRVMAEQFDDLQGSLNVLEGPKGSTLIAERNRVALGVLREQIRAGKQKLAIFYGGAHMPDFERHLRDDFGLVRLSERWLTAWDLKEPGKAALPTSESQRDRAPAVPAKQ